MSKTYTAPALATKGNLIELTQFGLGQGGHDRRRYRIRLSAWERGVSALS